MRTNTLLSVAAALAASAFMAQAQVYSVNIVGYVNDTQVNGALNLIHNPLDNGTNTLATVVGDAPNGSQAWVWNGSSYDFAERPKAGWSPDLAIPTGTGFFLKPNGAYTATYVGEVGAAPGESVTNALADGVLDLTGSLLPYATASIATDSTFGLDSAPNGSQLYTWNGTGYDFSERPKAGWNPDRALDVADAFFIIPNAPFDWVQALPAN